MRTAPATRTGFQQSTQRYRYLGPTKLPFTNKSDKVFLVIVGLTVAKPPIDGQKLVTVTDNNSSQDCDQLIYSVASPTTQNLLNYLPRKVLVPPNSITSGPAGIYVTLIQCETLEDALAIL